MRRGIFFLVAGPAGVGKTTLLRELLAKESALVKAISVTTREPRSGEVDGKSYFFWDDNRFDAAVAAGEFLEHAVVHGFKYGTPVRFIEDELAVGVDVIKDIDVQGFEQIRRLERFRYPHTVGIFVMPPSREGLDRAAERQGQRRRQVALTRIRNADMEMAHKGEYDYSVINDSVEHAVSELRSILKKEREAGGR